jgi:peptidoglycan/LPS O-acetylase OafA/YrhL
LTATEVEIPRNRARSRSRGIDVAKGLAILGVIAQHVLTSDAKRDLGGALWFNQAVPIFVVLFGLNAARNLAKSADADLRQLYSPGYFRSRTVRLIVPTIPIWVLMIAVAAAQDRVVIGGLQLIGAAPVDGGAPGDYFIALVIALALLFPALWWCYARAPVLTLVGLVALSVVTELLSRPLLTGSAALHYVAVANPFHVAAAVGAGVWLASQPSLEAALRRHRDLFALGAAASAAYLTALFALPSGPNGFGFLYPGFTLSTGIWALGWTLLLTISIVGAVDRLAPESKALAPLAELGKASYHVFLVQMAIIGLWRTDEPGLLALEALASLVLGWIYWRVLEGAPANSRDRLAHASGGADR